MKWGKELKGAGRLQEHKEEQKTARLRERGEYRKGEGKKFKKQKWGMDTCKGHLRKKKGCERSGGIGKIQVPKVSQKEIGNQKGRGGNGEGGWKG